MITDKVSKVNAATKAEPQVIPQPIIAEIYALSTGKNTAFRTMVGKDAKMVAIVRKILPIKMLLNLLGKKFIN
ncbi:hypothetical protein [Pedobacter sp. UYP1]|uniref:hypothetical protein n=1 Tax=Pedobacter sp. UYP1 TaxID=1756396 RepID=UPI0033995EF5